MLAYCPGAGAEEPPPEYNVLGQWLALAGTNWDKLFRTTAQNVVYIARYGAQSIDALDKWPLSKIHRTITILSDLIKGEGDSASARPNSGSW